MESVKEKSNYTMNTELQYNSWSDATSLNNVHIRAEVIAESNVYISYLYFMSHVSAFLSILGVEQFLGT